jgi:uncharacterized protein
MGIDYQLLIDEAMLSIARKVLLHTQNQGLVGDQSFYVSFCTDYPGVILSKYVRRRYPEEITIVLQHQYRDLHVSDDRFSVNIAFDNVAETIEVPFAALTGFVDPLVNFSLQFRSKKGDESVDMFSTEEDADLTRMKPKATSASKATEKKAGEVIAIDKFHKKTN